MAGDTIITISGNLVIRALEATTTPTKEPA